MRVHEGDLILKSNDKVTEVNITGDLYVADCHDAIVWGCHVEGTTYIDQNSCRRVSITNCTFHNPLIRLNGLGRAQLKMRHRK